MDLTFKQDIARGWELPMSVSTNKLRGTKTYCKIPPKIGFGRSRFTRWAVRKIP